MSAEDSAQLNEKIQVLSEKNSKTAEFKLAYTSIVDKMVSRLNLTTDSVNHNTYSINALVAHVGNMEEASQGAFEIIDLKSSYLALSQAVQNNIDVLHQLIIDLHNGILNKHFVSYKDLTTALKGIKIESPSLTWPVVTN